MHTFATSTEFLSVASQSALIATVQTDAVIDDETGTRYVKTVASEHALDRLVSAFMPLMEKEARLSKVLDFEDALSTCFEEFVATVRLHDLSKGVPFSKTIGTILRRKISDTDRTSDLVVVKESVAAAYWRLIHKHEGDFAAAYEEVKTTDNNLAASTFLAAHNVLSGIDTIETAATDEDEGAVRHALATSTPSAEETVLDRAEAEWLIGLVTDLQQDITRLAYGFSDIPEHARAEALVEIARSREEGVALIKDGTLSRILGLSRPKTQRERAKALSTMRAALEASRAAE